MVVHGHSEADAVEEVHNRINIDTGAYRTDILTAMGLEGTSRWFISTEDAWIDPVNLPDATRSSPALGGD